MSLLRVSGLSKTYPSGVQALQNINLEVERGEFLVIIGLSGSGKSTLLRCLNHLVEPTRGEIVFAGERIERANARAVRRRIAMIFQHFNLIPRHSVLSNVLMGRLGYTPLLSSLAGHFSAEDISLARKFLATVGLEGKEEARADQLSGGQQQRVAIARALCQNPEVLLADEPVASLDPATAHTVMKHLRTANRELGITTVCSLHFLSLVREYATRVVALKDGGIVFQGAPGDINEQWFKKIYGVEARDINVQ